MPGMIGDSLPANAGNGGGLRPRRFAVAAIRDALGNGWDTFRAIPRASVGFAALFVACGALVLGVVGQLGLSPMALPLAGGFMLVGPALLGAALAFMILAVSAFSVPLLHDRRATLAPAVSASVRAVVGNLPTSLAWALILAGSILLSILLLPLLTVTLPVLAYASQALCRTVFPPEQRGAASS